MKKTLTALNAASLRFFIYTFILAFLGRLGANLGTPDHRILGVVSGVLVGALILGKEYPASFTAFRQAYDDLTGKNTRDR